MRCIRTHAPRIRRGFQPIRRCRVGRLESVVSRIFASWNQLDGWLRQVNRLWRAA